MRVLRRLLMVLDEAATVASLDELDQLAATVSGLNVTLVTVIQDFSQLVARWGPRPSTIVNNHTTGVVLAGLADPSVGMYFPEVVATEPDARELVELDSSSRNSHRGGGKSAGLPRSPSSVVA